jgi:hypothetical protein
LEKTEESEPKECRDEEEARKRRIKGLAEELSESIFTKEAREHMVRAASEFLLAIDSMVPRDMVPPDVKEHYNGAKRETTLLIKAMMDAQLKEMDEMTCKKEQSSSGLRKIELK